MTAADSTKHARHLQFDSLYPVALVLVPPEPLPTAAGVQKDEASYMSDASFTDAPRERLSFDSDYEWSSPAHSANDTEEACHGFFFIEFGEVGSTSYRRLYMTAGCKGVSPWHGIPLRKPDVGLSFVTTTPRGTWDRFEPCADEALNPMRHCLRQGQLTGFGDCVPWNVGFLPQTWGDSTMLHLDLGGMPFDGRAVEVIEIGTRSAGDGEVYLVKPLTAFLVIQELTVQLSGRTPIFSNVIQNLQMAWRVLAIDVADPMASVLNDVEDLALHLPGLLECCKTWLCYSLCLNEADRPFVFGLNERPCSQQAAIAAIGGAHRAWLLNKFKEKGQPPPVEERWLFESQDSEQEQLGEAIPTQATYPLRVASHVIPEATCEAVVEKKGWRRLLGGPKKHKEGWSWGRKKKGGTMRWGSAEDVPAITKLCGASGSASGGSMPPSAAGGVTEDLLEKDRRRAGEPSGATRCVDHPGAIAEDEEESEVRAGAPPFWPKSQPLRSSSADATFFQDFVFTGTLERGPSRLARSMSARGGGGGILRRSEEGWGEEGRGRRKSMSLGGNRGELPRKVSFNQTVSMVSYREGEGFTPPQQLELAQRERRPGTLPARLKGVDRENWINMADKEVREVKKHFDEWTKPNCSSPWDGQ